MYRNIHNFLYYFIARFDREKQKKTENNIYNKQKCILELLEAMKKSDSFRKK